MDNHAPQLDTSIEIVTPENIGFRYQVAGPMRRLPAYLIDLVIQMSIAMVVGMGLVFVFAIIGFPGMGVGASMILLFILWWFYGGLFEAFWNGQTPGKRLMQIRVLSVDGQPINGLQAVLRNLLRAADSQPMGLCQVGLLVASMNDRFQRLGDMACGTMVVIDERQWFRGAIRIDEPEALRLAAQIPADFQASRTLGRALAAYVERRRLFPWVRRMEIARHLGEPLRDRFGLPLETNLDQLLAAVYHRTFITDREETPASSGSPFRQAPSPESPAVAAMAATDRGTSTSGKEITWGNDK
jgi:uncharacterized RDD family membrane protein YckC